VQEFSNSQATAGCVLPTIFSGVPARGILNVPSGLQLASSLLSVLPTKQAWGKKAWKSLAYSKKSTIMTARTLSRENTRGAARDTVSATPGSRLFFKNSDGAAASLIIAKKSSLG